jgi:hypothetical protein
VRSDVVVLRAPAGWHLERCRKVVVPFAGRSDQERLRARVLGSLARLADPEVDLVRLLPADADERAARARAATWSAASNTASRPRALRRHRHRRPGRGAGAAMAAEADLLVLGDAQTRRPGTARWALRARGRGGDPTVVRGAADPRARVTLARQARSAEGRNRRQEPVRDGEPFRAAGSVRQVGLEPRHLVAAVDVAQRPSRSTTATASVWVNWPPPSVGVADVEGARGDRDLRVAAAQADERRVERRRRSAR